MNAPQAETAMNGPAGNLSLADFPLASSTNDVAAPDFKTIAAGLFAGATTTTTGHTNTQVPQIPAKAVGSSTARERETKDNHAQPSETPSPFLTIIPVHLLNIVPAQYHLASHPQFSGFPAQGDTQADSFPQQSLSAGPRISTIAGNFFSLKDSSTSITTKPEIRTELILPLTNHENPHSLQEPGNDREPQKASEDKTLNAPEKQTQSLQDGVAVAIEPQILMVEEQTPENGVAGNQAVFQTSEASRTKKNATSSFAPSFDGLNVSEISTKQSKPVVQKTTANPAHGETNAKQTTTLGANLQPTRAIKDTADQNQAGNSIPKQANSNEEVSPAPQLPTSIPQPVSDVMRSMILETPALQSTTASLTTVQVDASTQPATAPVQSDASILKNDTSALPSARTATPVAKTTSIKGRTEAAPKSKTQRGNPDTQTTEGNISESRERNLHPASGPQNAPNAGSDKNHNADATLTNLTLHAKSAPAKNTAALSDNAAGANVTQTSDIDDAIPTTHTSINTAKLVQGLSQSELRVGLQTRDFGNIDIRTSVSHHEFSAQISVEHSDVAHTLSTELPGLYERLNEQQVQVSSIHIQNQNFSTSSGMDQHSQQSASHPQSSETFRSQLEPALPAIHEVLSPTDRLDIRI